MEEVVCPSLSSLHPPENQGTQNPFIPYGFQMTRNVNPKFQSVKRLSRKPKGLLRSKSRSDSHRSRPSHVNSVEVERCDQASRECQGIVPHQVSRTCSRGNVR